MKLRTLFECFKCFMIGNYKEINSGIEDNLYQQDKPIDIYYRDVEISYTPLYTPPTEDVITESCAVDYAYSQVDKVSFSANKCDEQDKKSIDVDNVYNNMAALIEELDMVKQKLSSEETIRMITFCQEKIIEGLSSSGAQFIDNDEVYSSNKHRTIPYGIYPDNLPIKRTIRPGLLLQNKVILKALVEL